MVTAVLLDLLLAHHYRLPVWPTAASIVFAFFTAYVSACATKLISGQENFTFYQALISVPLATCAFTWLLSQPILLYLDVTIISVGSAAVLGRIGCLQVGCCHGRPYRFGVRYRAEHAAAGFTSQLVGARLFPIQIVEGLCAGVLVVVGCFMIWQRYPPGAAAGWFVSGYCLTRFCFEFARWPANYQFKSGLSPYQGISLALVLFSVSLEWVGVLPFQFWQELTAAGLLLATAVVVLERRLRSFEKSLSQPDHIRELTSALNATRRATDSNCNYAGIVVTTTTLGLRISAARIHGPTGDVLHYALSSRSGKLSAATVDYLLKAILRLQSIGERTVMVEGNAGVIHFLMHRQAHEP
ncbi:MAG: phosphatidylglycerol---prolipoprotein diacylglyceryl transferase [Pyrinomonadaceae bacterium]|nr:phosphatidylglycerol---prolipoprotein diacylglyceryl transferase [Pyrinomonadaceae bacterium]